MMSKCREEAISSKKLSIKRRRGIYSQLERYGFNVFSLSHKLLVSLYAGSDLAEMDAGH